MIGKFNDITSENPLKQIWKFLRFFEDIPSVSETIRRICNIPKEKFKADVKKQARQEWMRAIDENVQIAELTDSLLDMIHRKFPNLILDQMTWVKHYVHL